MNNWKLKQKLMRSVFLCILIININVHITHAELESGSWMEITK